MNAQFDELGVPRNRVQRRTQFMRNDGEEVAFRPVRGFGGLARLALALEQPRAVQGLRTLARDGERTRPFVRGESPRGFVRDSHDSKDSIIDDQWQNRICMVARGYQQRLELNGGYRANSSTQRFWIGHLCLW